MDNAKANLMAALAVSDEQRRPDRAARIEWLSLHLKPRPPLIFGGIEVLALQSEAGYCYTNGHFIATVMVASAFVEQTLVGHLLWHDHTTNDKMGVSEAIKLARNTSALDADLLDRILALAQKRNAYAHLKDPTDSNSFSDRFLKAKIHPDTIREGDAQEALAVMDAVFHATLRPGKIPRG